jgi:peptidyl-prolyl cis-trans isomerase SurA
MLVLSLVILSGCGTSLSQLPVAEIQQEDWDYTITLDEFEKKYTEGKFSEDSTLQNTQSAYQEFLDRYINYRLKVKDAHDKGYDKDPILLKEFNTYRSQLAEPYFLEKEVIDKNLHSLYEKQKEEIRAAHILALIPQTAKPQDTLKAYNKILEAKELLTKKGAPFDSVALAYSDDPSVKRNNGELGYFSGGMMVHQFEDAAYQGKQGQLLGPVRTRYGYHLIKILDRRKRTLPIKASHIMVGVGKNAIPEDTLKAYQKISGILQQLQSGSSFDSLAKVYSDDKTSGRRGGDLGFFGLNRMVKPFEHAAFALEEIGELSPIVRTGFGYHIIKLVDRKMPKSFEESKDELKSLFKRNKEKVRHENRKLIESLKVRYEYREFPKALAPIESNLDTAATYGMLDSLTSTELQQTIIRFAGNQTYQLDSLVNFLRRSGSGKRKLIPENYEILKAEFIEEIVKDYEIKRLEDRYPEFARLMKNYKEGILLYKISEDNVWGKTAVTDSMAKAYYNENKSDFNYDPRIEVAHISVDNQQLARDLYVELTEKKRTRDLKTLKDVRKETRAINRALAKLRYKKDQNSKVKRVRLKAKLKALAVDVEPRPFETLYEVYSTNKNADTLLSVERFERGERTYLDTCFGLSKGDLLPPVKIGNSYRIYRLEKKLPAMSKPFSDAKPEIFSRLQEILTGQLEQDWVNSLRKRSEIKIYKENLNHAFQPKS